MNAETIIVKNRRVNNPHILSSGVYDATLIGESDDSYTEQQLTALPIGIRSPRGAVRVLMQLEYKYGEFLQSGKGLVTLYHAMVGKTGFHISAIHNLPNGVSRKVRIQWFGFGYEDYEASGVDLTSPPEAGEVTYAQLESFVGITDTIVLNRTPIDDPTLKIWSDRVPMFKDVDFSVSEKTLTILDPLTGVEAVMVEYYSKEIA